VYRDEGCVVIFSSLKILFEEKSDISVEAVLAEGISIGREGGDL
jgi:hypothetical protein